MRLRRLVPPGPDIDSQDRAALLEYYRPARLPWLRLNLVAGVDGSAAGVDGTSDSLTSRTDRRILGVLRELAQVVLVGAASVRAEGYQLPRRVPLAVATRSGDLGGHRLADPSRVLVLGPESARDRAQRTLGAPFVAIGDRPEHLVTALRARGLHSIVCEGGPMLAAELLAASLVDELCLTTAPMFGGPMLPVLGSGADRPGATGLTMDGLLLDDDGYLYARWHPAVPVSAPAVPLNPTAASATG